MGRITKNISGFIGPPIGQIPKTQNPTSHNEKLGLGVWVIVSP